jgi:hypothetical protein
MMRDPQTGALTPADINQFREFMPELFHSDINVDMLPFDPLIDSSDMNPPIWSKLANIIYDNYSKYDGFVITHGTDKMAYTASALSFMLENLCKPVVLTGSQLPVGVLRQSGTVPVCLIAGCVSDKETLLKAGFSQVVCINPEGISLEEAMRPEVAKKHISNAVREIRNLL